MTASTLPIRWLCCVAQGLRQNPLQSLAHGDGTHGAGHVVDRERHGFSVAAMTVGTQAATPVTADLERLNDVGTALKSRPRKDQPPRMRLWMQSATNVWADAA